MEPAQIPWFPAWGIDFYKPIEDSKKLVETWLEIRPSERWVMISGTVAASERHLWSVWAQSTRNEEQERMVARTIDAEFIRILSGTHQIRVAFERAGVRNGDEYAWLLYLPIHPGFDEFGQSIAYPIEENDSELETIAAKAMTWLEGDLLTARPIPHSDGPIRLGIGEMPFERIEAAMLTHAAAADL